MANEATKVYLYGLGGDVVDFSCNDATAITKGALLKVTDACSAALSAAANDTIAGIAVSAKEASDGSTRIGCYTNGIFKMYASGAISVGAPLVSAADANFPNYVKTGSGVTSASGAQVIGYALETAAAGETFLARIRI